MGKMFMVNRSNVIEQLHKIHQSKYDRASQFGEGEDWILPLADNVPGLGKSNFRRHYIAKSRELWKDVENKTNFQKTLCACHTVHIAFMRGDLLEGNFDSVMIKRLCYALEPMFANNLPAIFSNLPKTANAFLKELTKSCGPVFIVLDSIGSAFYGDLLDNIQQEERFLLFCSKVVGKWLSLEKVFFVLLGRGSFASPDGRRSGGLNSIPYRFERLNFQLLQSHHIVEILKNTRKFENDEITIEKHFGLSEEQTSQVADALFMKTNGHPRSLVCALKSCQSFLELMNYNHGTIPLQSMQVFNRM
jgi:hypothetical protein